MHMYTYMCVYIYIHISISLYICIYIYVYIHMCTYMRLYIYIYIHTCIYIYMYTYNYLLIYLCGQIRTAPECATSTQAPPQFCARRAPGNLTMSSDPPRPTPAHFPTLEAHVWESRILVEVPFWGLEVCDVSRDRVSRHVMPYLGNRGARRRSRTCS